MGHRNTTMKRPRCKMCPQTASIECMKNCTVRNRDLRDRNREVRNLLQMTPERLSMLVEWSAPMKRTRPQRMTW